MSLISIARRLLDPRERQRLPRLAAERLRAQRLGHRGARVGHDVKISGLGQIHLSPGSRIGASTRIFVGQGATLTLGPEVRIDERCIINASLFVSVGARTNVS